MVVSTETIWEAVLLSSVFLMAISLPKMAILTGWAGYRLAVQKKLPQSRVGRKMISEQMQETMKQPSREFEVEGDELVAYLGQTKMPAIEMLSAFIFMSISTGQLQVDQLAQSLLDLLMLIMAIVGVLAIAYVGYCSYRLMKAGGSPFRLPSQSRSKQP